MQSYRLVPLMKQINPQLIIEYTPENLSLIRTKAGISLRELAKECNCSYQTIKNYEKDEDSNPSFLIIKAIARTLNVRWIVD